MNWENRGNFEIIKNRFIRFVIRSEIQGVAKDTRGIFSGWKKGNHKEVKVCPIFAT